MLEFAPIATLDLVEITADGSRNPLHIEIRAPQPDGRGTWRCTVSAGGDGRGSFDIYGEDSLQALCLGLRMVHSQLAASLARGGRLVCTDADDDFPLNAYF
jgi:phage/plasmid primase-like uncharacterized protein